MGFRTIRPDFNDTAPPVLSLERAVELFDELAGMRDIAFGYAPDGCYARAHIMCRRMMNMGFSPQKAWAVQQGEKPLTVKAPNGCKIRWYYHVAPALNVRIPDDTVQSLVFDPSLFDGPVTLEDWGTTMGVPPSGFLTIAPFGQPPYPGWGDYGGSAWTTAATDANAASIMTNYWRRQSPEKRVVFESELRKAAAPQIQPADQNSTTKRPSLRKRRRNRRAMRKNNEAP